MGSPWRLRIGLGGAFAGLLAVGVAVSAGPAPSQVAATGPTVPLTATTVPVATTSTGRKGGGTTPVSDHKAVPPRPPGWKGTHCGMSLAKPAGAASPAVGHCTVLEIGDSLGNDLGWGLDRHLSPTSGLHLIQDDVSSTGLVNRSYYDWPTHLATELRTDRPQVVLVSLGGNDQQGMIVGGRAVQFPTAPWKAAYLQRVKGLIREATSAGAYVVWVGMPVMQQPGFSEGMAILDSLYRRAAASDPYAEYVSVWDLFADPAGGFASEAQVNGHPAEVRESDGVHYSFVGEDVLATYAVRQLAADLHVRLSPTAPQVITGW